MNQISNILNELNEQQLKAVTTTEGYVRVIAGAGSGKTKALTARYAYLVEEFGLDASNILCVTFTNKAAKEMRNRVRKLIGSVNDLSFITTYHGFCVKVLREDIYKIQYPKQFVIMDIEDQKTILSDIYDEFGINSRDVPYKQAIKHIEHLKSSTNYIDFIYSYKDVSIVSNGTTEKNKELLDRIFQRYLEKQQRNFSLDFNDLINFTLFIFENFKDVLEKWQKRLYYIQVDETQDSSLKQFYLVDILSQRHKNLFVVGDPDQTIYEWRGAKPEILVDFDKQFPAAQTVIMNQNYRSTPNILNLGNNIIKKNKVRIDKDMFTQNNNGVDVIHFHGKNDIEEGIFIANEILKLKQELKLNFADFAILYRANYLSRIIEQSLIKDNIPYSIWGGIRFFERKEIKDVLSYLRLIVVGDNLSFLRVINTPSRKLGKSFINTLKVKTEENNISLIEGLEEYHQNKKGAIDFLNLIKELRIKKDQIMVSDLIKEVLDKTGLMDLYRADEDRIDNIKELQNSIITMENEESEKLSLENYLQEIALYTDTDVENEKNDRVKLMTIHISKGLEFPYVFLCGFNDGILPSYMSIKERRERGLEEERRLTYVAFTRAEKALYMTESEGHNFQTGCNKYPSRFLFEIDEDLYVRQGLLTEDIIAGTKKQIEFENKIYNPNPIPVLNVGDSVTFSSWGQGIVEEKDDEKCTYLIRFENINGVRPIRYDWRGLIKLNNDEQ